MRDIACPIARTVVFAAVLGVSLSYHLGAVTITEYAVPSANSTPNAIAAGPDGALWFTTAPKSTPQGSIWRITTAGAFTEYPLPPPPPAPLTPGFITAGPDGALWFTAVNGGGPEEVAQITTAGAITAKYSDFGDAGLGGIAAGPDGALWLADPSDPNHSPRIVRIPVGGSAPSNFGISFEPNNGPYPVAIVAGSDGALWFTGRFWFSPDHFIGRITTSGAVTAYLLPTTSSAEGITAGPDGALWFTEGSGVSGSPGSGNKIGRITTAGAIAEYPIPTPNAGAFFITAGPDGALWFTERNTNQIGRITVAGLVTEYPIPTANSAPSGIATGPDGALWFTESNGNRIGRLVPDSSTLPMLISSTHAGSFLQGQSTAAYTLLVQNSGSAAMSGAVSASDALPAGLTATSIDGPGWACTLASLTCSRSDGLPAGGTYPPITVTLSVASNAAPSLTNQVSISGSGAAIGTAIDPTTILPAFADVSPSDLFMPAIDLLSEYRITAGCGANPPQYCENQNITEGQMAVFVVRSVMGGDNFSYTQTPYFSDVPASYEFFPWIQKMQDLGIALPCAPNQFCPDTAVTREIMAALIVRSRYGVDTPSNYPPTPYFTDVPATHPYFPWIQKMEQLGITSGCAPGSYCPNDPVTRGQMAVFIMRGEFNQLLPATTPIVVWTSPASISPGQSAVVTIVGQGTNFSSGVTQVNAGDGITVSNISVANGTTLTAQLSAATSATLGLRSITVTTGSEDATLPNGLRVQ